MNERIFCVSIVQIMKVFEKQVNLYTVLYTKKNMKTKKNRARKNKTRSLKFIKSSLKRIKQAASKKNNLI